MPVHLLWAASQGLHHRGNVPTDPLLCKIIPNDCIAHELGNLDGGTLNDQSRHVGYLNFNFDNDGSLIRAQNVYISSDDQTPCLEDKTSLASNCSNDEGTRDRGIPDCASNGEDVLAGVNSTQNEDVCAAEEHPLLGDDMSCGRAKIMILILMKMIPRTLSRTANKAETVPIQYRNAAKIAANY